MNDAPLSFALPSLVSFSDVWLIVFRKRSVLFGVAFLEGGRRERSVS